MKNFFKISLILLLLCTPTYAAGLKNDAALNGLAKTKAIFDLNQGDPDRLLLRLNFIDKTYQQLLSFGTTPKFVLAFRGKASRFVSLGEDYVRPEDMAKKRQIEEWIYRFKQQGMALEQCALAADLQRIATNEFLPQIEVVANGYISMIGYQNKGYAFVPMD